MPSGWKILGWALALIGAVVVVRKTVPWVAERIRAYDRRRALPPGSTPHLLPAGGPRSGSGPTLVDCGSGGSPAPLGASPTAGMQSSPAFRWCFVVRRGDTSGSIAEAITGDSARYVELLVANPAVSKRGTMGIVLGPDAWDFAEGALVEGSKIFVSQTMNAWVDQAGVAAGDYMPYPPDPRMIHEVEVEVENAGGHASTSGDGPGSYGAGGYGASLVPGGYGVGVAPSPDVAEPAAWTDGFDYVGGA